MCGLTVDNFYNKILHDFYHKKSSRFTKISSIVFVFCILFVIKFPANNTCPKILTLKGGEP